MDIRIAGKVKNSIVDGPGLRYVLFTQGCFNNCKGCQNPQTHDLCGGFLTTTDEIFNEVYPDHLIDGVTISGGEPFLQEKALIDLFNKIKKERPDLNLTIYTGMTWEKIIKIKEWVELIKLTDFIVDGPFVQGLANSSLKFRGSSNQRIIDAKNSLEQNKIILTSW